MRPLHLTVLACLALVAACTASVGGSVKAGHFFGHDLRAARSVVYVIDLSGSMDEESGSIVEHAATDVTARTAGTFTSGLFGGGVGDAVEDRIGKLKKKLEKVKLHLIASLQGLPAGARFNVILFAGGVQTLAPGMIEASALSTTAVSAFVAQLETEGGTNIYGAMEAALFSGASEIILLTDGMPTTSSPGEIRELVRRNQRGLRVDTVGVGGDQAREFLYALASENGGTYTMYD